MNNAKINVAILGASPKPERYANMAQKLLIENGYSVFPINPVHEKIEGVYCVKNYSDLKQEIHTLTLYMNGEKVLQVLPQIIENKPKRVIMNPGTESKILKEELEKCGVEVVEACTLVMLKTRLF